FLPDGHLVEQTAYPSAAFASLVAEQACVVREQLFGGEMVVEIRGLGEISDPAPHGEVTDGAAEQFGPPGTRKDELHEQLQRRRLSGPIRAEEAEHFARFNLEGESIERAVGTLAPEADRVVFRQLLGGEYVHRHEPQRPHALWFIT